MGFSRQEYCTGLPFPSPEDLPNPGIKPSSPALQTDALPPEPPGKPLPMLQCLLATSSIPFSFSFSYFSKRESRYSTTRKFSFIPCFGHYQLPVGTSYRSHHLILLPVQIFPLATLNTLDLVPSCPLSTVGMAT